MTIVMMNAAAREAQRAADVKSNKVAMEIMRRSQAARAHYNVVIATVNGCKMEPSS
jgi:hypothetical protein